MKKIAFLVLCFCLINVVCLAQKLDFSGEWKLDKAKSKLDDRTRSFVESQTLLVTQTASNISVQVITNQSNTDNNNKTNIGGNKNIYSFDGKETVSTNNTQLGMMDVVCKGDIQNDQLILNTSRTVNGPGGVIKSSANEVWSLSENRTILTVKRVSETQTGTVSSELVYIKVK